MARSRILAILILLAGVLLPAAPVFGGDSLSIASPDQIEALFIQRLVRYVTWPEGERPGRDGPVVVAATDARRLRPWFSQGEGQSFRLTQWPCNECRVLVLNGVSGREAAAILARVKDRPVLTIGQGADVLRLGAVVALVRVGDHIRLQVNPRAAARSGLSVSSRLLSIVRIYGGPYD